MNPYDEAVEYVLSRNDVEEARAWLEKAGDLYGVIHELSRTESQEIVEEAYSRGAVRVDVVGSLTGKAQDVSADMLLIILPDTPKDRELLFELEGLVAEIGGYEVSDDEGQKFVLLRWT